MPIVEKRYAEALMDLAIERNAVDSVQGDLGGVTEIYEVNSELREFVIDPEINSATKKNLFKAVFADKVRQEVLNFLMLLTDKERIGILPGIYQEFVKLADRYRNVINMKIISSVPLEPSQVEKLKVKYREYYKASDVKVTLEIDSELIGGIKVVIGDKVTDASLAGRLQDLRSILNV